MKTTIKIKNLRLRTFIGVYQWEQQHMQDLSVNVLMQFDGSKAAQSDDVNDTIDYKTIKQRIMEEVENSRFKLLEKLAAKILEIVLTDKRILFAQVEIDKPRALRFADSVSVTVSESRD